jgi:hypothetical protein
MRSFCRRGTRFLVVFSGKSEWLTFETGTARFDMAHSIGTS